MRERRAASLKHGLCGMGACSDGSPGRTVWKESTKQGEMRQTLQALGAITPHAACRRRIACRAGWRGQRTSLAATSSTSQLKRLHEGHETYCGWFHSYAMQAELLRSAALGRLARGATNEESRTNVGCKTNRRGYRGTKSIHCLIGARDGYRNMPTWQSCTAGLLPY